MRIFESVSETIKRYGSLVEITTDGKVLKKRAFVEPLRYKNKVYVGGKYQLLGYDRSEKYLYVGLSDVQLCENSSVIQLKDNKYIVKRCETYYLKDYPIYVWAILQPCGDDLEDDYESD
jgi:hypothetical protein